MVVAPIEDMGFEVIGVNSAKAANYVPSMCGLDVVYDDVENLVKFQWASLSCSFTIFF